MQELEKILEEIRKAFEENTRDIVDEDECHHFVVDVCTATYLVNKIIRKHTKDNTDGKNDNNGWIPVEERLPEEEYYPALCVTNENYYCVAVYNKTHGFRTGDICTVGEIVAWHPLPELYRPERNDNV